MQPDLPAAGRDAADQRSRVLHRRDGDRRLGVSQVIVGRLSHVPIVTIAVPVLAGGEPAGVAGGSLDLSQFQRFVEDFTTLADARVSILDQHER